MTRKLIVILGAGTGGTLVANRLRRSCPWHEAEITVVDEDDDHVDQPGLLFAPFGQVTVSGVVRPRPRRLRDGIHRRRHEVTYVDTAARSVYVADGTLLHYDVLVVATGAMPQFDEVEGLTGTGWQENVFTFSTAEGAAALRPALDRFEDGRLVVAPAGLPAACPVASLEFVLMADEYFRRRGIRHRVQLAYVTPPEEASARPVVARSVGDVLADANIEFVPDFATGEVDGAGRRLDSYDKREVRFDLAVVNPPHRGAPLQLSSR
ncbi:FAD/NAD(P)-binding oxidoreductase [Streptomyces sp. WMMC500]|uniref:NAD(P)/FAD-dependent oxidoreductase n=1 Tax=Streptomyces sp. WMMC500 TaxID=3015154 RepID=UPI00248C59A6|nr:FAD/NAD(P)-binding oxidoreductase [Streptomyces sp. WMMC500]WBB61934.1 FAD/NAD(P)-binding oxidoreductase [Streptomyces sp. WMMC500]